VSYGVTTGAVGGAVRRLRAAGTPVSALTVHSLWPLPETALARALRGVSHVVVAELNPGLYRREVERLAVRDAGGAMRVSGVIRLDGELITPRQIVDAVTAPAPSGVAAAPREVA
jgi:pyruvate/2-oxoacid:ferredoxin oxidoreductase alpha subunit